MSHEKKQVLDSKVMYIDGIMFFIAVCKLLHLVIKW